MTDGLAVTRYLEEHEPEVMESLINDEWVFCNRDDQHDHRWTGPMIDRGDGHACRGRFAHFILFVVFLRCLRSGS